MSSGGGTTNSANSATQIHGGATITQTRRRVADSMNEQDKTEKPAADQVVQIAALDHSKSDVDETAALLFNNGNGNCVVFHQHQPVVRYFLSRKRLPENWVLCVEECVLSAWGAFHSLTSRKNFGRTVFVFLLAMVVVSAFLKFSFLMGGGGGTAAEAGDKIDRTENQILFMHSFKNKMLSNAHMAVIDSSSSSGAAASGQKRQMKEFPVS